MKLDFVRDTKRNVAAAATYSTIKLLLPFLNRTLFLWLLGPAYLGLNGLFGSILGMLGLAELGFGAAMACTMYKLVAEDNRELFCAYLSFYRKAYRCVGSVVFIVGLCLMPFLRRLIHGQLPADINLYVLYLIHLTNTAASYFLFAYRGCILSVHNRNDVLSYIRSLVTIVQYVTVFLVLLLTRNYYYYVLITVVFTLITNLLIFRESRRLFPGVEPRGKLSKELRSKVFSEMKAIFLHRVGTVISYQVDNVVISAFLGLVAVAVYGNYYYVVTSVCALVGAAYASMQSGFGNKIHTTSKAEIFTLFMKLCRLTQILILWCAAMMLALYQPFITIWTRGDPDLHRHVLTPILMVLYFYVNQSRQALLTFKAAATLWGPDRWKPIIAGGVNLAVNILFVLFLPDGYKLDGVILSTILGYVLIQIPWETHVVFTHFFASQQQRQYWHFHARFAALALALCGLTWGATLLVPLNGLAGLMTKGVVALVVSGGMTLAFFHNDARKILERHRHQNH